jgi:glycosyltransferase involved in cell wall biosynthesis
MNYFIVTTTDITYKQFLRPVAVELLKLGHSVTLISCLTGSVQNFTENIEVVNITFRRRVLSIFNVLALVKLRMYFNNKTGVINVHTPIASLLTRISVIGLSLPVIYTVHGFHFHRDSNWLSWKFYYPLEKFLSKYTEELITINHQDYVLARNSFKMKSVEFIEGIGFSGPKEGNEYSSTKNIREELNISRDEIIILSIGELNKNKNHKIILEFMRLQSHSLNIHYLICGLGPMMKKINRFVESHHLSNRVHLLGYRNDVASILEHSNIFAFPSLREGLPVSLMEAIYFEKDVIAYKIRGIEDLIPTQYHEAFFGCPL